LGPQILGIVKPPCQLMRGTQLTLSIKVEQVLDFVRIEMFFLDLRALP
jgi:hypothetical protein